MHTDDKVLDDAFLLIKAGQYHAALDVLKTPCASNAPHWKALYLAGLCRSFLGDSGSAVELLARSVEAAPTAAAPVFLALGIALQQCRQLDQACRALARAIEIDPDCAPAFNSLALTQKLGGDFEKAAHNYDAGCKALARRIVKRLRNSLESPILKYAHTQGTLWMDHALFGALYLVSSDDQLSGITLPTAEQAAEEEATESRRGLYWDDVSAEKGGLVRLFLPNYFNTFREALRQDATYANLIGNRSTVLELLGRVSEARDHRDEAIEFLPIRAVEQ